MFEMCMCEIKISGAHPCHAPIACLTKPPFVYCPVVNCHWLISTAALFWILFFWILDLPLSILFYQPNTQPQGALFGVSSSYLQFEAVSRKQQRLVALQSIRWVPTRAWGAQGAVVAVASQAQTYFLEMTTRKANINNKRLVGGRSCWD